MIVRFLSCNSYTYRIILFISLGLGGGLGIGNVCAALNRLAVPEIGVYTGAYVEFGETEDDVTAEGLSNFETLVGKRLAVVAFSSYWGQRSFPLGQLRTVAARGAVPLIFWSPWDQPYEEAHPEQGRTPPRNRINLYVILSGKFDTYIDRWADAAKAYGQPMLVAWGLEMNGQWFPWSGFFHGAGKQVKGQQGYLGPETYKHAYRYVVDRVRARGAMNISWVFQTNGYSVPQAPWNRVTEYYPGPDYVDWLGMSAYGKQFSDENWVSPAEAMDYPYQEIASVDSTKPVILAEWGIGEYPKSGSKAQYIHDALALITSHYSRIKAAVFWHEHWQNEDGSFSDLRVTSSPSALEEYRRGIAGPLWLDQPKFDQTH
ncbi:mannan endo-1,4-beta-mannosidase [Gammaproteobacteria bacterium]